MAVTRVRAGMVIFVWDADLKCAIRLDCERSRKACHEPAPSKNARSESGLNPREQRHRFPHNMSIGQTAPLCVFEREPFFFPAQLHLPIQLIENPMRRLR